jgi:hypothetical protein
MAYLTIAQLSASGEILPTDLLPIHNQGITKKVDIEKLFSRVQTEYVPLSGGSMFGPLTLSGNLISFAKIISGGRELFDIFDTLDKGDQLMRSVSGTWMANTNTVSSLSSYWNAVYATVNLLSSEWESVYDNVDSLSASWNSVYGTVLPLSALWNTVYQTVLPLSASWNSVHGTVLPLSASWNTTYETVLPLSASWNSVHGTVLPLSANWNSVYSSVTATSANWDSVYNAVKATSGNWDSVYSAVNSTSGNWDSVYSNVQAYSGTYQFLPLSGGTVDGNVRFNNTVTIYGDLCATGDSYFVNTYYNTTSAIQITHYGSGDALYVGNDGTGHIASFVDIDGGIEILHVGGENSQYPNVGVKTSYPNKAFTVNGEISSNNTIHDQFGDSTKWNSVYNSTKQTSATWDTAYFALSTQPYLYATALSAIRPKSGNNSATGESSSVLGGENNSTSGSHSIVSGGKNNTASGLCSNVNGGWSNCTTDTASVVGGGSSNIASEYGSVVSGGVSNTASGYVSNVGGGKNNTASGYHSNVAGGLANTASGDYSGILGGKNNTATYDNSFVIGSDIKAHVVDTTFVNNLSSQGIVKGTNLLETNWNSVYSTVYTVSTTWIDGPSKKFDFIDFGTYQITYGGLARYGTPTTATEWTITRLTLTLTGVVTASEVASNVAWDNRQNVLYV